jgi:hypothetical protein
MFNWAIRRPIATSRVSSGSGGRDGETFVDDYWQNGIAEKYENMINNPDLNPGQRAILESEEDLIKNYLAEVGADYDPDDFLDFLQTELTDGKYEALSITFEEYSEAIEDDWDHSVGGDGFAEKKFLGRVYS